jgi:hypothetical protein
MDPCHVGAFNSQRREDLKRKNGVIINTGGRQPWGMTKVKIAENRIKYEKPKEEWSTIELQPVFSPAVCSPIDLLVEKKKELEVLKRDLENIHTLILKRRRELSQNVP